MFDILEIILKFFHKFKFYYIHLYNNIYKIILLILSYIPYYLKEEIKILVNICIKYKDYIIMFIFSIILLYFLKYVPSNYRNPEAIYSYLPVLKFLFISFLGLFHIGIINKNNIKSLRIFSIYWSIVLMLLIFYLNYYACYCVANVWSKDTLYCLYSFIRITKSFVAFYGIDSMSLIFLTLTSTIFVIIFLFLSNIEYKNYKNILLTLYIIYIMLIQIFTTENLLLFFFFFESIVFPMYFIIVSGGSRFQRHKAAQYFFYFTVIGSLLMFLAINILLLDFSNLNIHFLVRRTIDTPLYYQQVLWFCFFISFAIKIPMFPFHTWLPEAHVEAPTHISVLLAGILLKLGIYGMIRILFILFPLANQFFADYVIALAIIGALVSGVTAIKQVDIKRMIAYASISHMNIIVIGLYVNDPLAFFGSIFQCIGHGYVAAALFISIGILYDRYKTRLFYYYGGLVLCMPLFSTFFFLFILANIAFPLTSNFIGELLIFLGISKLHLGLIILSISSIIVGTAYSLWMLNRIIFGNLKTQYLNKFKDLTIIEKIVLISLFFFIILLGIYPNILFYFISEQNIEEFINFIILLFKFKK